MMIYNTDEYGNSMIYKMLSKAHLVILKACSRDALSKELFLWNMYNMPFLCRLDVMSGPSKMK